MKNLYPNLHQFFGGYFHQDCFAESATAVDVVKSYQGEASLEEIDATVKELHSLLTATAAEDELANIVSYLGSYYDPSVDGLDYRQWLMQICTLLENRGCP